MLTKQCQSIESALQWGDNESRHCGIRRNDHDERNTMHVYQNGACPPGYYEPLCNSTDRQAASQARASGSPPCARHLSSSSGSARADAGVCPTKVQFKGTITTDGAAEVKYTWASFDGGTWPEGTIKFTAAGTRPVSESREVFAPGQSGWMQLKVLSPNTLHSTEAKYTFTCRTKQPPAPKRK